MKRIGVFGGAFNPPHIGHLNLAQRAVEQLRIDVVYWVPARTPPHKDLAADDPGAEIRARMVEAAIAHHPRFELSRLELDRETVSYAVDTVRALHALHDNARIFFLIGEDWLNRLHTWHQADELVRLTEFVVYGRPNAENASPTLEGLKYTRLLGPEIDISSSEIRNRLQRAEGIRYMVTEEVLAVIEQEVLYSGVRSERLAHHIREVERAAVTLSERWGIIAAGPRAAARYHDAYRHLAPAEMLRLAERAGLDIDDVERTDPILLHGPLAAHRAEMHQAVLRHDPALFHQMIDAVRHHTTGRPGMGPVVEILIIADCVGKTWRSVDEVPLDRIEAVREAMAAKIGKLGAENIAPHPCMRATADACGVRA